MGKQSKRSHEPTMHQESSTPAKDRRRPVEVRTVTRINRRLVVILSAVLLVSGACVHALHAFMVDRNAGDLRERSLAAESEGDTREAIRLLSQYRQFRPDDLDATERLAGLLLRESDAPNVWQQTYDLLEAVLRKDASRTEARRTLIDVAMKLRRYADAEVHIDALLAIGQDDAKEEAVLTAL